MAELSMKDRLVKVHALRIVQLDKLQADMSYQRGIKGKVAIIIRDFNEVALGLPLVGEREDGGLWIVDGLQRVTALRKMERKETRCEVFKSTGPEYEAVIYKLVNMNRTRLKPAEEFKALLTAQDETAWEIKNKVEKAGFRILLRADESGKNSDDSQAAVEITCVSALLELHKKKLFDDMIAMLPIIQRAWPSDRQTSRREILIGAAHWHHRREGLFDKNKLIRCLQTVTPHAMIYASVQSLMGGGERGPSMADQFEKVYRKRVKRDKM
jgi:hypothetical protein